MPPIPEHIPEQFAERACGAALDLYVGYDERLIAKYLRDLMTSDGMDGISPYFSQ